MTIRVHRQHDGAVSHYRLHGLGVGTIYGQPGSSGMAEGVEVECLSSVVLSKKEVRLPPAIQLLRLVFCLVQPRFTGSLKVGPKHAGEVTFMWQAKYFVT